ncbi:WD repeat-containing protein 20 isoform X2 [Coregonus clupeaformis]|uniref:WD repeat-containing protein 20 isoform X2 n=1 Tax=Coregonus clupeaformis TaxID=59861 RepID=UPI001BDF86CE|nr:WD repeat-containing protein 20 isoform X2 [Coregonus clupeaformis]
MAAEGGGKEMNEIKTQFTTREGVYKLLTHSEYSRPNRVPFNSQGSNPVKVSFVNVNDQSGNGDRICFNVGRELYFYIYKGVRKMTQQAQVFTKLKMGIDQHRRNGYAFREECPNPMGRPISK